MRRVVSAASGLVLLVLAQPALAAGVGETGWGTLLWQALNLILLLAVVIRFAAAPVKSFFSERRRTIESQIRDASHQLDEAEAKLAQWSVRLDGLDEELRELRDRVREQAEAEAGRILAQAQEAAERIRRDARAAIEQESERARARLRADAGALAVEVGTSLLREHINDEDRMRLVGDFVERVEHTPRGDGTGAGG